MDIITRFSNAQVITVDAVSDIVNSYGNDAARNVFMKEPHLIKVLVAVIAAGMAEGIRIEFRFDTEAGLNSGSQIICGDSGVILPAQLETVGVMHQFRTRPIKLASGYDFSGIYYNLISNPASGGFALTTWLADEGPEDADAPM